MSYCPIHIAVAMIKFFFYVLLTVNVGRGQVQRISDVKCTGYSEIPENMKNSTPCMAVWIETLVNKNTNKTLVIARPSILLSDSFLISEDRFLPSIPTVYSSRVFFDINDSHDVIRKFQHTLPVNYGFILLKIRRISLDILHRPVCIWTGGELKPSQIKVGLLPSMPDATVFDSGQPEFKQSDLHLRMLQINNLNYEEPCNTPKAKEHGKGTLCFYPDLDGEEPQDIRLMAAFWKITLIQQDQQSNYFIFGLGQFRHGLTSYMRPFSEETIEWIEAQVWKSTTDSSCGKREQPGLMTTTQEEFPWHTALFNSSTGERKYQCGGTLVNEDTVITAAHCVSTHRETVSPTYLLVVLGTDSLKKNSPDARESSVTKVIIHDNYDPWLFENDIAILKLSTLMLYSKWIQPICLTVTSNEIPFERLIGVFPGWGLNELGVQPDHLRKGSFPIRLQKECRTTSNGTSPMAIFVNENNFCAGFENGTTICRGDSGGGLVFECKNQWFLKGVASVGVTLVENAMCDPLGLGLFTDVVKFIDWIKDNM